MQSFLSASTVNETLSLSSIHHILSGSFRSLSLFLLAFSPLHRTLTHLQTVPGYGPHQYLATSPHRDKVYTTSWALPPTLSSWTVEKAEQPEDWRVFHLNTVSITATSSYITLPSPYTHIYSAGGPTGEVHAVNSLTGSFGNQTQRILFIPEEELEAADKTRVALRYGAHGIEFALAGQPQLAFIPVLGTESIEVYTRESGTGELSHVFSSLSPRPGVHDGPRHVKVHPNGKVLYCVTEHSNFLDVYTISSNPPSLTYVASRPLLPKHLSDSNVPIEVKSEPSSRSHHSTKFRGDTLLLSPSTSAHPAPRSIFATTRGAKSVDRGWLSVFALDNEGLFDDTHKEEYWQTPTSGGKANALDVLPKSINGSPEGETDSVWILVTDDDDAAAGGESNDQTGNGGVRVLEWDGWNSGGVRTVAEWPSGVSDAEGKAELMKGGSHAVWLD